MRLLDGKKVLVAGVANKMSIGWSIAQALHTHGAQIALSCIESNVRRVKKLAPQVHSEIIIPCDVTKDEDIVRTFDQVGAAFGGKLDILVHSIASAHLDDLEGEFIKTSRSGWHLALDISAYSLVAMARSARPLMNAAGGGSIMTLSYGDSRVSPNYNIMGVAKAALEMAVRYLAYDLGPENIRVNVIGAGPIPTLSSQAVKNFIVALRKMEECSPLLRNITVEEVAKAAVYLASDLSSGVTGEVSRVDGGMTIVCPAVPPHRRFAQEGKT